MEPITYIRAMNLVFRHVTLINLVTRTRPEFRSDTRSGGIWACTAFGPVPLDLACTRPVPRFCSGRVFKVAKRTVENR